MTEVNSNIRTSTKTIKFRLNEELEEKRIDEFSVELPIHIDGTKSTLSESGSAFLYYLEQLDLIENPAVSSDLIASFFTSSSLPVISIQRLNCEKGVSFKVRKKANILGLKVIPNKSFEDVKAEALKRVNES